MAQIAGYAAVLFSVAATSALLTAGWIGFARRRRIQDLPGQRRLHAEPTPRGGGVAIAAVLIVAWLCIAALAPDGSALPALAAGVGLFAAAGLIDDLMAVPAKTKFILQLIAAAVMVAAISHGWPQGWLAAICLTVACCYVVNIWNFMDGSNGLIATQAMLIAIALAIWPGQPDELRMAALALAGACAGFLPFNLPGARVFLGDVGSHALGAAVFGLLLLSWQADAVNLAQALMMGTVLLLDSGYTLLRRVLAGRQFWRAHREHLYQYAVRRGYSHARVCLFYGGGTVLSILLAALAVDVRSSSVMWGLFIVNWLLGTTVYFGLRRQWLKPRTRRGTAA